MFILQIISLLSAVLGSPVEIVFVLIFHSKMSQFTSKVILEHPVLIVVSVSIKFLVKADV